MPQPYSTVHKLEWLEKRKQTKVTNIQNPVTRYAQESGTKLLQTHFFHAYLQTKKKHKHKKQPSKNVFTNTQTLKLNQQNTKISSRFADLRAHRFFVHLFRTQTQRPTTSEPDGIIRKHMRQRKMGISRLLSQRPPHPFNSHPISHQFGFE